MKSTRMLRWIVLIMLFSVFSGCKTAKLIEYSSTAGLDQKTSHIRTEMQVIKSDNEKITRDYFVVSAVDFLPEGKKNYYLIIVPTQGGQNYPLVDDLLLFYDYPYIIEGSSINDLIKDLEKIVGEWDTPKMNYSAAVYNFTIVSSRITGPVVIDDKCYEITPYIKFDYSKTDLGAMARLTLGNRLDEVVSSVVDGKTVKNRIFSQNVEKYWMFDTSDKMKDFLTLLNKGQADLSNKGMENRKKKEYKEETVIKEKEVIEDKTEQKEKTEKTEKTEKKEKKTKKKKR